MDAWETLIDNSTLTPPGFDAWEHLNAQGGSGPGGYILVDTVEVELMAPVDVEILNDAVDLEIVDDTIEVDVDTVDIEVEITNE